MKKSWNEVRWIDRFLSVTLSPALHSFFLKKMEKDIDLKDRIRWQLRTYQLIRLSARRQLKKDIQRLEAQLLGPDGDSDLHHQMNRIWKLRH